MPENLKVNFHLPLLINQAQLHFYVRYNFNIHVLAIRITNIMSRFYSDNYFLAQRIYHIVVLHMNRKLQTAPEITHCHVANSKRDLFVAVLLILYAEIQTPV